MVFDFYIVRTTCWVQKYYKSIYYSFENITVDTLSLGNLPQNLMPPVPSLSASNSVTCQQNSSQNNNNSEIVTNPPQNSQTPNGCQLQINGAMPPSHQGYIYHRLPLSIHLSSFICGSPICISTLLEFIQIG